MTLLELLLRQDVPIPSGAMYAVQGEDRVVTFYSSEPIKSGCDWRIDGLIFSGWEELAELADDLGSATKVGGV